MTLAVSTWSGPPPKSCKPGSAGSELWRESLQLGLRKYECWVHGGLPESITERFNPIIHGQWTHVPNADDARERFRKCSGGMLSSSQPAATASGTSVPVSSHTQSSMPSGTPRVVHSRGYDEAGCASSQFVACHQCFCQCCESARAFVKHAVGILSRRLWWRWGAT